MPILKNQRHEMFCQYVANGLSQTAAYVKAGYSESNARMNASRLNTKDSIRARIMQIQGKVARKVENSTEITCEWIMQGLRRNYERAIELDNGQVANRALELMGKQNGMFIERQERVNRRNWADYAEAELADLESQAVQAGVLPPEPETETVQ